MTNLPIEWMVNLATMCIVAGEWATAAWDTFVALWVACAGVFQEKTYVVFEHDAHPYDAAAVQPWASGSAVPRWRYNATRKEFLAWGDVPETRGYTLPWLSLEVLGGDRVQYDLTDFIEGLRVRCVAEERQYPTLPEVLGVWTTSSGIVLHPTRFTARLITDEGDTKEFTLDGKPCAGATAAEPAAEEAKED